MVGALVLTAGYQGPPELTLARAFSWWTFDPWVFAFVVVLGGAYLVAVRRVRRGGADWAGGRVVSFVGLGLGGLVVATMSWTGAYAPVLFYARAVQTVLLLLVVPLFLALGRPVLLALAVLPGRARRVIEAVIRSRIARILTFPPLTALVLVAVPFTLYFSSWYTACFHSTAIRVLTYLALMAPGYVFFWTLLRVDPVPREYPYLMALWITIAEVIGDAVLGVAVIASSRLIGGAYYHALARPWGPGLRLDQMLGGGTLWVLGDVVGLPFLVVQLFHMIKEDEAEAAVIDAELDAAAAVAAGGSVVAANDRETADAGETRGGQPLWWESDPRFTGRFKAPGDAR